MSEIGILLKKQLRFLNIVRGAIFLSFRSKQIKRKNYTRGDSSA
jgi:hypothetical protein